MEPSNLNNRLFDRNVWRSLDRICSAIDWSHDDLLEQLCLNETQFQKAKNEMGTLPAHAYLILSDELGLNIEDLAAGKVDYNALSRHYSGDELYMPERYTQGAFSRRRTSLHLIDFSDSHFGYKTTDHLLRKLQVKRLIFENPDETINIRFLMDACEYFVKKTGSEDILYQIGARSSVVNRKGIIGQTLSKCASVKEAYDLQINQLMNLFDKNCDYHTPKLTEYSCIIESRERSETLDAMSASHAGSPLTCLTRVGVASAISTFVDVPRANVVETHCVHRGDPYCRFAVDYEHAAWVHRRRQKSMGAVLLA
jgi:hypothetical protein